MLQVLLVDDEMPARDELKYLLSQRSDVAVIGEADDAAEAIRLAVKLKPDVIFLDIEMREVSGLEAGVILRRVVPDTLLVFATAYDSYAIKAFEVGAIDYLLKPFEQARIDETIERLKSYRQEDWRAVAQKQSEVLSINRIRVNKLALEKDGKIVMVPYQDILYAYAHLGAVKVVLEQGGKGIYSGTLADFEDRVRGTNMMRVHKSYLVNLDKVREVVPWFKGTYWLKVEGSTEEIPVSKTQIKEIKEILGLK